MKKIYRNLGIVLGIFVMMACSDDPLQEKDGIIGENPNADAEKIPPNEQWAWVGTYPGEVSNLIQRLEGVEVKVDGDYEVKDQRLVSNPGYLQSTGLYVPPAEAVTIILPAAVNNLRYQIGIASWNLPTDGTNKRYNTVYAEGELTAGENRISSNFGGPLYFYFDGEPQSGELTLTVNGVVKTSDFVLDETNLAEWRTLVTDSINPMIWGELIGKRIIMTLPIATLKNIERPDALLKFYDKIIEEELDFFGGLSGEDFSMPWRIYSDLQLPNADKVYPFYPMGFLDKTADSLSKELIEFPMENLENEIIFGGLSALYAMPWSSTSDIGKQLQQMPRFRMFQRKGEWLSIMPEMSTPIEHDKRLRLEDEDKLSMVIQLVQEYGWDLLTYVSEKSRTEMPSDVPEQYNNDILAIYASEYAGVNLTEFFSEWGFPVSMHGIKHMENYGAVPVDKFWELPSNAEPNISVGAKGTSYPKDIPEKDTIYDRNDWEILGSSDEGGGGIAGQSVRNMLDGDIESQWHSNWNSGAPVFPNHYVEFGFDEVEFNYIYHVQIYHAGNSSPRTFNIDYLDENGDWKVYADTEGGSRYKEFYLHSDPRKKLVIHLNRIIKAKGVKISYISSHDTDAQHAVKSTHCTSAEFGIGLLK